MENQLLVSPSRQCSSTPVGFGFLSKEKMVALNGQEMEVWEYVVKNAQNKGEISSEISAQSIAELFNYSFAGMSYSLSIENGASLKQLEHMLNTVYRIVAK